MNITEFQQKVSQTEKPVIVDFWAGWCVPCRMTKPVLEALAHEYADTVDFLPVNADDSRDLLEQFKVMGIPTVLTLRAGQVVSRVTGAQDESNYRRMFEAVAEGRDAGIPLAPFDRLLRLGAGGLLILVGVSTGNWLVAGAGAILAFLGIYDRCPVWAALRTALRSRDN